MSLSTNFPTIKPTLLLDFANTKQLDPRITFTRASTATYYDGKTTAKAEENLLTYSQDFDNAAWIQGFVATTPNTVAAPDGTVTADTVTAQASTNYHDVEQLKNSAVAANTALTISVYLKANTNNFASLIIEGAAASAWVACAVNLSTGVITQTGAGATGTYTASSITNLGNSWYRVSLTGSTTAVFNKLKVALNSSATPTWGNYANESWTTVGTESIYVWGAQLEQRSSVTAYTATTTAPIINYIPALQTAASGVARFDNNPTTGESLGLLIEEQRTNLLLNSGAIATGGSSGLWNAYYGASFDASVSVAPDGTLTASSMYPTTGGGGTGYGAYYHAGVAATSGVAYTLTVYAKSGGLTKVSLGFSTAGASQNAVFNLATGAIDSGTGTITPVGDGWYRCSITVTAASTGTYYPAISFSPQQTGGSGNKFANVFVWGAQCEAGAFATSYIPTTSAQVTRSADAASMTGTNFSSWWKANEGTIFGDSSLVGRPNSSTGQFFLLQGAGNGLVAYQNAANTSSINIFDDVNVASSPSGASAVGTSQKFATAFSSSGLAAVWAGGAVATTSAYNNKFATATGVTLFGAGAWNGTVKKLAFYPARVTNAQLQALTS